MKDLQNDFLNQSIIKLEKLKKSFGGEFSEGGRREAFRTFHTIKGTAQTFGFAAAGLLAHELETLLSGVESIDRKNFTDVFIEGVELLEKSLKHQDFDIPKSFFETVRSIVPARLQSTHSKNSFSLKIPPNVTARLSPTEKDALESALLEGKAVSCFAIGFDSARFTADFKKLREELDSIGEVIAVSSSLKFKEKVGFEFLFASSAPEAEINQKIAEYSAIVIFRSSHNEKITSFNNLEAVCARIGEYGESLGADLGKKIEFSIAADKVNLSPERLKIIFDVLLHLVRNAVDHGIKAPNGKIGIQIKKRQSKLYLKVADDGRGIDLDQVKRRAIEKKLISADEKLSARATLELIFQSELSTAAKITSISGRGVGLDAVKHAVESIGGEITVNTETEKGTSFEIYLSAENPEDAK